MQKFRVNLQIKAPEVRLIGPEGEQLGIMPFGAALKLAQDAELDLVEVAPNAAPPVVRVVDLAKFRYQQQKAEQQSRKNAKKTEVKTLRLSVRISEHDILTRVKKAEEFLQDGHLVKLDLRMRGREQAFPDLAKEQLDKFSARIQTPHRIEVPARRMGHTFSATLAPNKL